MLGCEPSTEEISFDPDLRLTYSTDTITFDTLFSSVGSITKRFKIYNPNDKAIQLNQLSLGTGNQSSYSLTVNGAKDKSFQNEIIYGNDSLLVLVEVLIDPSDQDLPFLVKDSVEIVYNARSESIKLVSWGQDAVFINNEAITCNTTWTKERPYVVYDSAWVAQGCQLIVEAGTKIYIDNDALFTIAGSIVVQGTSDEKVEISDTRLDAKYDEAPGQWGSLFFFPGSTGNLIDHAIIKNGTTGIIMAINLNNGDGAELQLSNTSIQHMSESGIAAFAGTIDAHNLEIFHCQNQLFGGFAGGIYTFNHCTFSNEPNDFTREGASVGFTNYLEFSDGTILANELSLQLTNSIVWGREDEELAVDLSSAAVATVNVERNIIRSSDQSWAILNNFISQEDNYPGFYAPNFYDYQIDSLSNARDSALISLVTHDILGTTRDAMPDIGAYERKDSIP
ncbi:MAG: hypothetical protein R8N23_00210 [Reichenbachiella sp.]|uniref:hypothetical protein n=1 Tax=Reichenbachiella sp. TaxID=2184521 RepID=UPI00296687D5|nr:hypothetical protein [Reichenbachiella sp.]MDW3208256.1 hypothetical protein [Reichenbachiella sp.]